MGMCQSPLCSPEVSAGETRGCPRARGHGKHLARRPQPLPDPEPSALGRARAVDEGAEPLVPLTLLKAAARRAAQPKSAPAAGSWFQEPDFHILQVRVGSEKLPAMTGNPANSPNSSWPSGRLPGWSDRPMPMPTAAGEPGKRCRRSPGLGSGTGNPCRALGSTAAPPRPGCGGARTGWGRGAPERAQQSRGAQLGDVRPLLQLSGHRAGVAATAGGSQPPWLRLQRSPCSAWQERVKALPERE